MNRREASRLLGALPFLVAAGSLGAAPLAAETQGDRYPRLSAAVAAINDAIAFMEKAPDTFAGHKAAALQACRAAVRQLNLAMAVHGR